MGMITSLNFVILGIYGPYSHWDLARFAHLEWSREATPLAQEVTSRDPSHLTTISPLPWHCFRIMLPMKYDLFRIMLPMEYGLGYRSIKVSRWRKTHLPPSE